MSKSELVAKLRAMHLVLLQANDSNIVFPDDDTDVTPAEWDKFVEDFADVIDQVEALPAEHGLDK